MKISEHGLNLIKQFEGCRLHAYKCPAGVWTIGYGHTNNVKKGMIITPDEAEQFLLYDIKSFENKVNKYNARYSFTQNEFDALVSFCFNIGNIDGLTQNGWRNKREIAEYMLKYVYASGVKLKGLENRRAAEYSIFTSNVSNEIKSNEEIAAEVIRGLWSNGRARKKKITDAGYDYSEIQKIVNELKKSSK